MRILSQEARERQRAASSHHLFVNDQEITICQFYTLVQEVALTA